MTLVEEVEKLWKSNEVRDLSALLKHLTTLLDQARENNEKIPLELELDILLAANYSSGYGGQFHEGKNLILLLHRLMEETHGIDTAKVYKLACTASSSLLTILTSDEHKETSTAWELIPWANLDKHATKEEILQEFLSKLLELLTDSILSKWYLELISFIITFSSLLEDLTNTHPTNIEKTIKALFSHEFSPAEQENIKKWKSEWLEKNDYFRFIALMMNNKHAPEELWMENAARFTGL